MEKVHFYPTRHWKDQRPQQEWKEIIAIYLYLAGLGAGSFIIGTLVNWFINPSSIVSFLGWRFDLAKASILWGPVLVAIGAPFLILDLGIKRRFLYACLNPRTSWVARGFLILSAFIVFGLVLLVKSAFPFEWLIPQSPFWIPLEVIAFALAFGTALYTGILLKATKSVPLWNTHLLPLLFLASALSTGSMGTILSMLGSGLFLLEGSSLKVLMRVEQILVVIEAIVLYLFLFNRYKAAEQGKDSVRLLLFGQMRSIFWGGIVLLGFVFPFVLETVASLFHGNVVLIFLAGLLLLFGGFFLRVGILYAGIKDRLPMIRLVEIQYALAKNPKSEYRHPKQIQNSNVPMT